MLLTMWTAGAVPDRPEAGSAMLVSVFQVGISTGSFVGGLLVDAGGPKHVVLLDGVLALLAAGIVAVFGRRGGTVVAVDDGDTILQPVGDLTAAIDAELVGAGPNSFR